MIQLINEERFEVIKLLPDNWEKTIEEALIASGEKIPTVNDDVASVYGDDNKEAKKTLKRYGFLTPEIEKMLS